MAEQRLKIIQMYDQKEKLIRETIFFDNLHNFSNSVRARTVHVEDHIVVVVEGSINEDQMFLVSTVQKK